MAKLWRKRNMEIGEKIAAIEKEIRLYTPHSTLDAHGNKVRPMPWPPTNLRHVNKLHLDIGGLLSQRISHRESRTFFQSEVVAPSELIMKLIYGDNWKEVIDYMQTLDMNAKKFKLTEYTT